MNIVKLDQVKIKRYQDLAGEIGVMYRTAVQVISFVIGAIANYKHIFFTFTMISFKMDGNVFFLNLSSVTWDY